METKFFWGAGKIIRLAFFLAVLFACIKVLATRNVSHANAFPALKIPAPESLLTDFRSEVKNDNKITLYWKTSSSTGLSFVIEKSRDGENFSAVNTRNIVQQNSNEFAWVDQDSKKFINCYRVRITDDEGNVSYSKVMVVNLFKGGEVIMVGVTPDMTANELQTTVQLKESSFLTFNVTNEKGEIVKQQKNRGTEGMNIFTIEGTNNLKPGTYFLNVIVNGSDKLLVQLIKS
jgi:hypothetical protein